jgi:hypothetical protein
MRRWAAPRPSVAGGELVRGLRVVIRGAGGELVRGLRVVIRGAGGDADERSLLDSRKLTSLHECYYRRSNMSKWRDQRAAAPSAVVCQALL